jgi:ferredoxin
MIVADRKNVREIRDMIQNHERVLLVGCGTCVTVCLAGGEREAGILGSALRMALRLNGREKVIIDEVTIERQCEDAFIDALAPRVGEYDAICSLACGAGVQALAERFPKTPVYPGLNTQFIGILESQGVWTEKCAGCGNCRVGQFVGICPITRCAKRQFNGPCGGSQDGHCEVNPNLECAWQLIYDRAKGLGKTDLIETQVPPADWSTGLDGGPRKVVREDQCIAGLGPKS